MPPSRSRSAAQPPGFSLRAKAERDLDEIAAYTLKTWGDAQLVTYMTALHQAFEALAADPNLGRPADDIRSGYLRHLQGSHMVYFKRTRTGGVEVVRVLHVSMSPRRHLS